MSHYKLIYFNARARAEIVRLVFAAAGVEFEDCRVSKDEWAQLKPCTSTALEFASNVNLVQFINTEVEVTPMGKLPVLETDGVTLCQSLAIARYLARKFGLAGKTDLDQARVDIVIDSVEDATKPVPLWKSEKDETRKAELKKTFIEETLPTVFKSFETFLQTNSNGDEYFAGDSLTLADLYFYVLLERLEHEVTNPLEKFEKLKALTDRVTSHPKIAEYIAKRPA